MFWDKYFGNLPLIKTKNLHVLLQKIRGNARRKNDNSGYGNPLASFLTYGYGVILAPEGDRWEAPQFLCAKVPSLFILKVTPIIKVAGIFNCKNVSPENKGHVLLAS